MTPPARARTRRYRIIHSVDEIPKFATEQEEREFWETHDFSADLLTAQPVDPDDPLPPPSNRRQS